MFLKAMGISLKKKQDLFDNLSIADQLKTIPKLQSQFNALCNCRITNVQRASTIIIRAYILLLKDSFTIYSMISKSLLNLCEKFGNMSKKETVQFLSVYKLFVKETNAIIKIYDGARSISSNLPQVEKIDESIIAKLESTIGDITNEDDDNNELDNINEGVNDLLSTERNVNFNQKDPKTKKEGKSESSESSSGGEEQNDMDNIFRDAPQQIQNTPKKFNPFSEPQEEPKDINDPLDIFGSPSSKPKSGTTGGFNPFGFDDNPKTKNPPKTDGSNNSIIDFNLFGTGDTNTNNKDFNPFSPGTQTQQTDNFNPFGGTGTTKTQTQTQSKTNPFL